MVKKVQAVFVLKALLFSSSEFDNLPSATDIFKSLLKLREDESDEEKEDEEELEGLDAEEGFSPGEPTVSKSAAESFRIVEDMVKQANKAVIGLYFLQTLNL